MINLLGIEVYVQSKCNVWDDKEPKYWPLLGQLIGNSMTIMCWKLLQRAAIFVYYASAYIRSSAMPTFFTVTVMICVIFLRYHVLILYFHVYNTVLYLWQWGLTSEEFCEDLVEKSCVLPTPAVGCCLCLLGSTENHREHSKRTAFRTEAV